LAVVADEHDLGWRHVGVKQMDRRLGVEGTVLQDNQVPYLALEEEGRYRALVLGQCRRDQACRHAAGEDDGTAHRRRYRRQSGAAQETAARRPGAAPENQGVGSLGIVIVEFEKAALLPDHGRSPSSPTCGFFCLSGKL
jgi:hypothetical protein